MRSRHFVCLIMLSLLSQAGCGLITKRPPIPANVREARLINVSQPADGDAPIDPRVVASPKQTSTPKASDVQVVAAKETLPPINVLAISGGGSHGAFDVGVLAGWTAAGNRPTFDVVTGISTGAFIATFAFLGQRYDDFISETYLRVRQSDVFEQRAWLAILCSDSIASSAPLKRKIEEAITPELLKEVAAAHAAGRRLYIGTTNLDTRRLIIWDMGAIASSNNPDAVDLYRKVVLASGSVPAVLPPVLIDVEVDGEKFEELHVDGGASAAVFVPMSMAKSDPRKPCARPGSHVYVISSGKLYADTETVRRRFIDVTAGAVSSMLYAGSRNDIFRIFNMAMLCSMEFHLIAIPQEVKLSSNSLSFDPVELRRMYELGFEMGKTRKGWRNTPPGTEISEQVLPRTGTTFRTEQPKN